MHAQLDLDELRGLFKTIYPNVTAGAERACINTIRPYLDNSVVTEPNFPDVLAAAEEKIVEVYEAMGISRTAASMPDIPRNTRNSLTSYLMMRKTPKPAATKRADATPVDGLPVSQRLPRPVEQAKSIAPAAALTAPVLPLRPVSYVEKANPDTLASSSDLSLASPRAGESPREQGGDGPGSGGGPGRRRRHRSSHKQAAEAGGSISPKRQQPSVEATAGCSSSGPVPAYRY